MIENKKISSAGYGIALISPTIFEQCRKKNKIRTKKMLSYFDSNNEIFYDFISDGAIVPIHHLIYDRYSLFFETTENNNLDLSKWEIICDWEFFNLTIDNSNSLWLLSFEELENWNIKKLAGEESIDSVYYDINDNPHIEYKAIKFTFPFSGQYCLSISGLKKKLLSKNNRENYGFLFKFKGKEKDIDYLDPSEINFHKLFEDDNVSD